jgi:hypothetical protein
VIKKSNISWGVMPCSLIDIYRHFEGKYCLHIQDREVSQGSNQQQANTSKSENYFMLLALAYSLTLKMEAIRSSETSLNLCWVTLQQILELDGNHLICQPDNRFLHITVTSHFYSSDSGKLSVVVYMQIPGIAGFLDFFHRPVF